ncbi:MAG TPA: hypothetical protein VLA34_02400, partial [Candidatus Krumholzibacterium sp.]|nr:hypothetical protein [Candidatus Krumholzibacterium sp.]
MHRYILLLAASLVISVSCGPSPSAPSNPASSSLPGTFPQKGVVHWRSFLEWDETKIAEAAEAEIAIFPMSICLSDAGQEITGRMKEINPDLKIIGYQGLLMLSQLYSDTATVMQNTPYEIDYHLVAQDHWAWTTTGDTLSMWPGSIFLNPFTEGEPDEGFMSDLIDLLEEYNDDRPGAIDGIMHDYFMYRPYIGFGMEDVVTGDIDLDGNGVVVTEDLQEREMFLQWQIDFAAGIRRRLGDDFIQIGNGRVPQENEQLASVINGIFYEVFPNMRWNYTDLKGLEILLDNQREGYLSQACGRTWS